MKFLRNLLATLVGLAIFSVIGIWIFVAVIAAAGEEQKVVLKENAILHLKLNKVITDREIADPFGGIPILPQGNAGSLGMIEIKEALRQAKNDDKIAGVFIETPWVASGFAIIEEIRAAIEDFKTSGKFVVSYGDFYTEGAYYLASVADEIYLNPKGDMEFNGIAAQISFFKGTLDKLGIEPQVFRVGQYKSAVESYTRKNISDANRVQINSLLKTIQGEVISKVAASRSIEPSLLDEISNKMLVRSSGDAVSHKLVTDTLYRDQVMALLKEKTGQGEDEEPNFYSYTQYRKSYDLPRSRDRIAVIVAAGDIVWGKGTNEMIGSDVYAAEIRKAKEDDRVKAIVLRINSPGGNYLASDIIWREIQLASDEKPVIASMSSYAASGGYYLAMAADTIVASATTITGSIGIYRMFFNMGDFMADKLGIDHDGIGTGEYSDMYSGVRSFTETERQIIQKQVDEGYETFTSKAAKGRNMSLEDLKEIAQGRAWTGSQAAEIGLVDFVGDFDKAVQIAAEAAGLDEGYSLRYYPIQKTFVEEILNEMQAQASTKAMKEELGELYPYVNVLKKVKYLQQGIQARMPYEITIK